MSSATILDRRIRGEQVRSLYQQSPFIYLGILFAMTIVAAFFWNRADRALLIGWIAAIVILTLARTVMVLWFRKRNPQDDQAIGWGYAFAVSSLLSGILWGSIALLFLQPDQFDTVLLVAVVLTGMCAGSLVPLSAFVPAYFGFCVPAMLPLAIVVFTRAGGSLDLIAYLVAAFIFVMLGYSFTVNRNLADSIRLRFENLDLLENLRQQKEIAEKANAEKSRFLAATSHDLRQPLHAMDLYLGALGNLLTDAEHVELLQKSRQSGAALKSLLEALMDISRLDAGSIPVNPELVDVGRLLGELQQEYHAQATQCGIELRLRSRPLKVYTDRVLLGRMIRNLLSNAISHSHGQKILLAARRAGEQVRIEVRDNGRGIPAVEQEQVFSEFYQLENPERDRSKGLGLGLAIVRRLGGLLDADIDLVSASGRGSCFRLALPEADETETDFTPISDTRPVDVSGMLIFLIEDEVSVREAMTTLLKQWGCELLVGDSLGAIETELDKLEYPPPDLVISDYRLRHNRNGLDAILELRRRFASELPAIIVTGDTDKAILGQARRHGCLLLNKPVTPDALRTALADSQASRAGQADTE